MNCQDNTTAPAGYAVRVARTAALMLLVVVAVSIAVQMGPGPGVMLVGPSHQPTAPATTAPAVPAQVAPRVSDCRDAGLCAPGNPAGVVPGCYRGGRLVAGWAFRSTSVCRPA